jgi:phosphatidate cytidylyltransferase
MAKARSKATGDVDTATTAALTQSAPTAAATAGPSNLLLRVISAVVAVPLILLLIFRGPPWAFFLLTLPVAMLGAYELLAMTHPGDKPAQYTGIAVTAAVCAVAYFYGGDPRALWTLLAGLPPLAMLFTLVRLGDIKTAALRLLAIAIAPLMVGVPLTLLAIVRRDAGADGPSLVVLALAFAWAADTGGYFAGRYLGKHALYAAVSPKKTIEGAIGGIAASLLFALVYRAVLLPSRPLVEIVVLTIVATVLGQAGDLGESLFKRSVGVKDSGAIVPGHGGILDRVDALLLTSTTVFLYTLWWPR